MGVGSRAVGFPEAGAMAAVSVAIWAAPADRAATAAKVVGRAASGARAV